MKRIATYLSLVVGFFLLSGEGCSSDPNVEGAKLDLRNKDYDRAIENLETAIAANPENAEAHKLMGDVLSEKAFTVPEAAEHTRLFNNMVESYGQAGALGLDVSRELTIAYWKEFERGTQAFNRGANDESEYDSAADYFANASSIYPDSSAPFINRAYSLINAGRTTEAIEPFEAALERGDVDEQTYVFLADLYRQDDRGADAVTLLETASDLYPENLDIQAQLLNAYQMTGELDRAMAKYQEEVNRDPENKLYRYNYGSLLLQAEMYDLAIEQLSEAVRLDPDYGNAQYNLGASYINKAVSIADTINVIDDEIRAGGLTDAEEEAKRAEIDGLTETKRATFASAVGPLAKSKELAEADGEDTVAICQALFSAYVQTGMQDEAMTVQECAGYEDE
jgi:tetratricopeptide (TPR) repeat protein